MNPYFYSIGTLLRLTRETWRLDDWVRVFGPGLENELANEDNQ